MVIHFLSHFFQRQEVQQGDRKTTTQPLESKSGVSDRISITVLGLSGILGFAAFTMPFQAAQASYLSSVGKGVPFTCNDSELIIKAKLAPTLKIGTANIYIGYQQVSILNKNPILIRFDNGRKTWCRNDYETTNDDGTGYGLLSNGGSVLYGVFTSTGTQTGNDFRRFSSAGWLTSYGSGGGAKVAILAQIDLANGNIKYASFISARNSNGNTNSLFVKGLSWTGSRVVVQATSAWLPRRTNRSSMVCTGPSGFNYRLELSADLKSAVSATADTCY